MRIAIAGGGIGGLAAALSLAGPGREVTLYERRTGFGEPGAGIQLSPNASRLLEGLGLGPALRRVAVETEAIAVRSLRSGRALGRIALGAGARERYGAPYLAVARADLHTILLDAVRAEGRVRIRLGRRALGLEQGPDAARLRLGRAGGEEEVVEAELVVAADGVRSALREAAGDGRSPVPSGYAAYRAMLPPSLLPPALSGPEGGLWLGPGRHLVHYRVAAGGLVNVVLVAPGPARGEDGASAVSASEVAASLGRSACPDLASLPGATAAWSAWPLHDLPARRMARGRLALLGDAAHPVLPFLAQGGALAIEDAAVLADRLAARPDDIPAALADYARERLPRVRRVQRTARRNALAYHAGPPVSWLRDHTLARLGPEGLRDRYGWVYDWRPPEPKLT